MWWLNIFPGGVSHDDLVYIMSSKLLFWRGTDLSGVGLLDLWFGSKTEGVISPIPAILLAPYYGLVHLNLFTARVPYVLLNLYTGLGIYVWARVIKLKKEAAVAAAILFLFNPWSLYLARLTTDTAFALMFFVWGMAGLLFYSGRKLIWPGILLWLGFFSYHGAKPLMLIIVVTVLWYRVKIDKSLKSFTAIKFFSWIILFLAAFMAVQIYNSGSVVTSRGGEIILLNRDLLSAQVNDDRRLSIRNPFANLINNKPIAAMNLFLRNYTGVFSGTVFFTSGDPTPLNNFARHGMFYVVDAVFLGIGLFKVFLKNRKGFWLLIILGATAPLASAIHTGEVSIVNRSFLLLPVCMAFVGEGFFDIYSLLRSRYSGFLTAVFLSTVMLISVGNFIYYYFFMHPILSQESFFISDRVVANIARRRGFENKVKVIVDSPKAVFLETAFYIPVVLQNKIWEESFNGFLGGNYKFRNFEVLSECPEKFEPDTTYIVKMKSGKCGGNDYPDAVIADRHYGGAIYSIFNDRLCREEKLEKWLRYYEVSDYNMEFLSNSQFCSKWLWKPVSGD